MPEGDMATPPPIFGPDEVIGTFVIVVLLPCTADLAEIDGRSRLPSISKAALPERGSHQSPRGPCPSAAAGTGGTPGHACTRQDAVGMLCLSAAAKLLLSVKMTSSYAGCCQ